MRSGLFVILGIVGMAFNAGCSSSVDSAEGVTESTSEALASGPVATFVTVRKPSTSREIRNCKSFFVKTIGTTSEVCQQIDLGPTGLDTDESVAITNDVSHHILRGRVLGTPGAFVVDAAWKSAQVASSLPGTLYAVRDTGIVCFAAPCRSIEQTNIKTGKVTMIAGVDVSRCSGDMSNSAALIKSANGAIVVATTTSVSGAAGDAPGLRATMFIAPVVHVEKEVRCGARSGECAGSSSYCEFTAIAECGHFGATGVCKAKPQICPLYVLDVCGCDGVTYRNFCFAAKAGAGVLHDGACEQSCGSRGMAACGEGSFCDRPESTNCGEGDKPGVCRTIPDLCTMDMAPVCGCDHVTYNNACFAATAGISVASQGACSKL